jgi:thiamine kinase
LVEWERELIPLVTPADFGPRLAVGRTAEVFACRENQILKLYQRWMPASDADHEAEVTSLVRALGLPVPQAFGRVDVDGRPGIIFERVVGGLLLDQALHDAGGAVDAAETLARLHAAMHARNAPALPRLRDRLADRITHAGPLPTAWREAAIRLLEDLPDGDALCHGDFHPANVMLTEAGPVIIDWLDATSGHPLADVARTVILIRYAEVPPDEPVAARLTSGFRAAFVQAYLGAYRALRPASEEELQHWLPVVAAARLAEGPLREQDALLNFLASAFGPASA